LEQVQQWLEFMERFKQGEQVEIGVVKYTPHQYENNEQNFNKTDV
jgi:uncharacterized protein YlbG (UPF0298 family)